MSTCRLSPVAAALTLTLAGSGGATAQPQRDLDLAAALWRSLDDAGLGGERALQSAPFPGRRPHGAVLQAFYRPDESGAAIELAVLRNYGGSGVGVQAVAEQPRRYLQTLSVASRRAATGADGDDWFWVQYRADGTIDEDPDGVKLVGRAGTRRCAGCHAGAGADRLFGQ